MNQWNKKNTYLTSLTVLLILISKKCFADYRIDPVNIFLGLLFLLNFSLNFFMLFYVITNPKIKPNRLFLIVSLISFFSGYYFIFETIKEISYNFNENSVFLNMFSWLFGYCSLYLWISRNCSIEKNLHRSIRLRFFILSPIQMTAFDLFPASDHRYFETFLLVCLIIPIQNLLGSIYRSVLVTSILLLFTFILLFWISPVFKNNHRFDKQSFLPVILILVIKYINDIVMDLKFKIQNENKIN